MRYIFIGGIFLNSQNDLILRNSSGIIQNAANVYQASLLNGLDAVCECGVEILNLPFVGSWPSRFRKLYFPSSMPASYGHSSLARGVGFLNITLIKHFARFISLCYVLLKRETQRDSVFIIYSVHLPFIAAVLLAKKIRLRSSKVCLVVPDLPEFMSDEDGKLYKFFKAIDLFFIRKLIGHIDGYVLLTDAMAEKLNIEQGSYIVVEGIANDNVPASKNIKSDKKVIFYSGTLASRYGIRDLVEAFKRIECCNCELWICGEGDSRAYIESAASLDERIKYHGQLPREKVIELQMQSTVLVNPRLPLGEYTKYSFPSKIIEYMSTGRPVVMHKLPGIPAEYFQYCFTPELPNVESLQECLAFVLDLGADKLDEVGQSAKRFVLDNKSCVSQAARVRSFLEEVINEK